MSEDRGDMPIPDCGDITAQLLDRIVELYAENATLKAHMEIIGRNAEREDVRSETEEAWLHNEALADARVCALVDAERAMVSGLGVPDDLILAVQRFLSGHALLPLTSFPERSDEWKAEYHSLPVKYGVL